MTDNNITLLESAIHITKERDKRSLANELVEIIADYLEFDSVLLLTVPIAENPDHLEIASFVCLDESSSRNYQRPDTEIFYDDLINKVISENKVASETIDNTTRTIFPITVSEKVIGLLVVYHPQEKSPKQKLVHGFLRIYGNFIGILNDN